MVSGQVKLVCSVSALSPSGADKRQRFFGVDKRYGLLFGVDKKYRCLGKVGGEKEGSRGALYMWATVQSKKEAPCLMFPGEIATKLL